MYQSFSRFFHWVGGSSSPLQIPVVCEIVLPSPHLLQVESVNIRCFYSLALHSDVPTAPL
jgi:hypothetical protein